MGKKNSTINNYGYDSAAERARHKELLSMEDAGIISDVEDHPRIELEPGIYYKADFGYNEKERPVYEDVKGVMSERFSIIIKIWRIHGPGVLRILKRKNSSSKFKLIKTINSRREID